MAGFDKPDWLARAISTEIEKEVRLAVDLAAEKAAEDVRKKIVKSIAAISASVVQYYDMEKQGEHVIIRVRDGHDR